MNRRRLVSATTAIALLTTLGGIASKSAIAQSGSSANSPVTIPEGAAETATGEPVIATEESEFAPTPRFRTGVLIVIYEFPRERLIAASVKAAIGGPAVSINTEKAASVFFEGAAGQAITVNANRPWQLEDPLGRTVGNSGVIVLQDTGTYVMNLGPGLRAPATVELRIGDASTVITKMVVGGSIALSTSELRPQLVKVPVRGGQRYRLSVPGNQAGAKFCAQDWTSANTEDLGCATGVNPKDKPGEFTEEEFEIQSSKTFVPTSDQEITLVGSYTVDTSERDPRPTPASISARITEIPNDVVVDLAAGPIVNRSAEIDQSVVVPFWGNPSERGVLSSPVESEAKVWGDPWIDRETSTVSGSAALKVFATPVVFDPQRPPFVSWSANVGDKAEQRTKRYGVYRGEDTVITVPTTGEPTALKNAPWFAAVASMTFEPGDRYVVQVTGKNIRPLGLALRDPSGKFSSNRSPWQWTSSDTEQRAVTTVTADRGGRWALELRPSGDSTKDFSVSALRVGSGGSYLGAVEVDDVLSVGEKTDVQLGPNEFARLRVKLTTATPQIIQPEVLRYRNKTFQPTAADMSIWDSRGRLVWSNNRNLEEEVLSGRLGKEPELSEKYATVASADAYTLVISPKGDLAGRFRVSVTSTPVVTDVRLGEGLIPRLPGGTRSGVLEVRTPTRYRITGTNACIALTSVREWASNSRCVRNGRSITLAPGVYRFSFVKADETIAPTPAPASAVAPTATTATSATVATVASTTTLPKPVPPGQTPTTVAPTPAPVVVNDALAPNASFAVVATGTGPDADPTASASLDGGAATLPAGSGEGVLSFAIAKAGTRTVLVDGDGDVVSGTLERPDGDRQDFGGAFVAPLAGTYRLRVSLSSTESQQISVRSALTEVQRINLALSKKPTIVSLKLGQRLEAFISVPRKTRIELDVFSDEKTNAGIDFLYAANEREERFPYIGGLPAGRYRLVFVGRGENRITLRPFKIR
jgi:hypothetical protein